MSTRDDDAVAGCITSAGCLVVAFNLILWAVIIWGIVRLVLHFT